MVGQQLLGSGAPLHLHVGQRGLLLGLRGLDIGQRRQPGAQARAQSHEQPVLRHGVADRVIAVLALGAQVDLGRELGAALGHAGLLQPGLGLGFLHRRLGREHALELRQPGRVDRARRGDGQLIAQHRPAQQLAQARQRGVLLEPRNRQLGGQRLQPHIGQHQVALGRNPLLDPALDACLQLFMDRAGLEVRGGLELRSEPVAVGLDHAQRELLAHFV